MYRVKFRDEYIVVSSEDLARSIENLVRFVEEDKPIDVREAIRTIGFLKKYKSHSATAVELVRLSEAKILEMLKKSNADLW